MENKTWPITRPDLHLQVCVLASQSKYKEGGRKSLSQSFYSQLPETTETHFAKTVAELQSEVRPAFHSENDLRSADGAL